MPKMPKPAQGEKMMKRSGHSNSTKKYVTGAKSGGAYSKFKVKKMYKDIGGRQSDAKMSQMDRMYPKGTRNSAKKGRG